jgi:putative protein kinase ArgK-like GTPase of G3E family
MISDVVNRVRTASRPSYEAGPLNARDHRQIARAISVLEGAGGAEVAADQLRRAAARAKTRPPVIGITGTGGAGKSSLSDELLSRFVRHFPDRQIAVVAMDPTRRRSGGALLGDRIRMNSLASEQIFMRSLATRRQNLATSAVLKDVIDLYALAGFDLIVVETAGIGQSDTEIVDLVDLSLYVMTSEYGAASQLEKIDMLDFADLIVLNKSEKRGAADSLRDVRKQWRRQYFPQSRAASMTPASTACSPRSAPHSTGVRKASRAHRAARTPQEARRPGHRAMPQLKPVPPFPRRAGRSLTQVRQKSLRATRSFQAVACVISLISRRRAAPRTSASRRRRKPRAARTGCTNH